MISFLIGIIENKFENSLELNVNGVGFVMMVSTNTISSLPLTGETVKIYTYMAVREDDISLYGFSSLEERDIFLKLITVSGVGPKLAIGILSGLKLSDLVLSIVKEDIKLLSNIKGLGKKTAERICLELKGKFNPLKLEENSGFDIEYDEDAVQMATDTLISLGINKNEAYNLARANATKEATAEEVISKALRGYKG